MCAAINCNKSIINARALCDDKNLKEFVPSGAYDLVVNSKHDICSISYKINAAYPANNIIDMYNKKLEQLKYVYYYDNKTNIGDRKWGHFVDATVSGYPLVYQWMALWKNGENKLCFIGLRYLDYKQGGTLNYKEVSLPENNVLNVMLQFMPAKGLESGDSLGAEREL
jgi:hypothetical protein